MTTANTSAARPTEPCMGTRGQAEYELVAAWKHWKKYAGPLIATRKEHKKREAHEREAKSRLAHAGSVLAWHLDGGKTA